MVREHEEITFAQAQARDTAGKVKPGEAPNAYGNTGKEEARCAGNAPEQRTKQQQGSA